MDQRTFVVSDLHLGGAPPSESSAGFQMCSAAGRDRLARFVRWAGDQGDASRRVTLVLNGDVVDFLAEPPFAPFTAEDAVATKKLRAIIEGSSAVWEALNTFVADGGRLVVLLGNHDPELSLPGPRRLLHERIGPGDVEFLYDGQAWTERGVLVEHGNQYDEWNKIAHDELRRVRSELSRGIREVAPLDVPGSRLVIEVMNDLKSRHPFVDLLKPELAASIPFLVLLEPDCFKKVSALASLYVGARARGDVRNIGASAANDGAAMIALAAELAGIRDMANIGAGSTTKAFAELWRAARASENAGDGNGRIADEQLERLQRALKALLDGDRTFDTRYESREYLEPAEQLAKRGFRAVVFGHTHLVKRIPLPGGAVYLNTGTWADLVRMPAECLDDRASLRTFADALATNDLRAHRKLWPTFAQVDYGDGDTVRADVHLFSSRDEAARVNEGILSEATP